MSTPNDEQDLGLVDFQLSAVTEEDTVDEDGDVTQCDKQGDVASAVDCEEDEDYPFINLEANPSDYQANILDSGGDSGFELNESCEFDFVGLAQPTQGVESVDIHEPAPVEERNLEAEVDDDCVRLGSPPKQGSPQGSIQAEHEFLSPPTKNASLQSPHPADAHLPAGTSLCPISGTILESALEALPDLGNNKENDFHLETQQCVGAASPSRPPTAELPHFDNPRQHMSPEPIQQPTPSETQGFTTTAQVASLPKRTLSKGTKRAACKTRARNDGGIAPGSPLSPVTPGKTERFGGGYFTEGCDNGVDAYLRVCYEMRTAPITKLTANAGALTAIDLEHRGIGNRGGVALASLLRGNRQVTQVNLGDNNLSAEGAGAVLDALAASRCVQDLVLSGNTLSGCMPRFASVLGGGSALRRLDVSSCKIGDEGAAALAAAMRGRGEGPGLGLVELRLDRNQITDAGFEELCAALELDTCLGSLSVQWNRLGSMAAIAAVLAAHPALTALDLTWNKIGAQGCAALARALSAEESPALQSLNISNNEIGVEACMPLARALQANSRLQRLQLSGNAVGAEGARTLLSGVGPASPLLRLDLRGCGLGRGAGLPLEVLAAEGRSRWADADNVHELRRVCPALLGTLPPREKPTPPKKKTKEVAPAREWVGVRNVPDKKVLRKAGSWKPGGTAVGAK